METSTVTANKKADVAMLPLFTADYCLGWGLVNWVVTTSALGLRDASPITTSVMNMITAFVVNFTIPYIAHEPPDTDGQFIFGGISLLSFVFAYVFVPGGEGKTLEQLDILSNEGVPIRRFGNCTCEEAVEVQDVVN
ncbi:uncharacterized protein BO66DRAFT_437437 [Aspergillus aculeatinus CBS 121060]|uniref:Uncharacterized protein n=1 Tax=Aspergillus aculeatinus CBS 121060 TaxID=1448322 RepID=A0ACD1HDA3_9EURO|nr:hypothetical protein BO66DRAFT_437437 [Aspergillus aculeatinus CBS 121060]RAH71414.1 hypothetical protein BO66DRAFT_437437 [Aspergillus aculeatinus CBS 121060]